MIARAATGSFRDALGTLEQLVTYGGKEVKLDDVLEILGVADAELMLDAAEALADHDPKRRAAGGAAAVRLGARLHAVHARPRRRTCATCSWSRRSARCPTRSRSPPSTPTAWPRRPSGSRQGEILRAIDLLAAAIAAVKDGSEPRIQLEMALLKATQPQADLSLQALMFRIEQLERRGWAAERAPAGRAPARRGGRRPPTGRPRAARRGAPGRSPPSRPRRRRRRPSPQSRSARSTSSSSGDLARGRRGGRARRTGWSARRSRGARRWRSRAIG